MFYLSPDAIYLIFWTVYPNLILRLKLAFTAALLFI